MQKKEILSEHCVPECEYLTVQCAKERATQKREKFEFSDLSMALETL